MAATASRPLLPSHLLPRMDTRTQCAAEHKQAIDAQASGRAAESSAPSLGASLIRFAIQEIRYRALRGGPSGSLKFQRSWDLRTGSTRAGMTRVVAGDSAE